jgi:hypothetical protein
MGKPVLQSSHARPARILGKHAQRLKHKIAILGYYPILSEQSGGTDEQIKSYLEVHGVSTQSVVAPDKVSIGSIAPKVVENCLQFWKSSSAALQLAVEKTNKVAGTEICRFVQLPFSELNAMWAPQSLLWELNPILLPEDEVAEPRCNACEELYGDIVHLPQWIQCDRASAGHPNIAGAASIAEVLDAMF